MTLEEIRKSVESIHLQILSIPAKAKEMKEKECILEAEWAKVGRVDYWENGHRPSDGLARMALVLRDALIKEWVEYCRASGGAAWYLPADGEHKCTRLSGNLRCMECGASYAITLETAFNKSSRFRAPGAVESSGEFILVNDPLAIEVKRPPFFEAGSPFYVCVDKSTPWVPEFYCAVKRTRGIVQAPEDDRAQAKPKTEPTREEIFNEPTVNDSVGAPSSPFPSSMPLRNDGPLPKKRK